MKKKIARQEALRRVILNQSVASQNEMVEILQELGFEVTQSSISRDARELGLVRVGGRYVQASDITGTDGNNGSPHPRNELIISVEPIGANTIVVKTPPGRANVVAVELDERRMPEIAGTIAGDDTIFVAVRSRSAQGRVISILGGVRTKPRG